MTDTRTIMTFDGRAEAIHSSRLGGDRPVCMGTVRQTWLPGSGYGETRYDGEIAFWRGHDDTEWYTTGRSGERDITFGNRDACEGYYHALRRTVEIDQ